tara:strand:- start:402 stop:1103 length:702 start_codon:yes stop_codon:yes gene_type:complete
MSILCAHRGASGKFPENTMSAFDAARKLGVKWLEVDLGITVDDRLIIFHDSELGRTMTGEGKISELKFDQIKNLDAGIWKGSEFKQQTLVTLRQLLSWQKKYNMNINYEIKCENLNPIRVISLIAKDFEFVDPNKIILSSFSEEMLKQSIKVLPDFKHALISEKLPTNWREKIKEMDLQAWHLNAKYLTKETVDALNLEGLRVRVYTVNDRTTFDKMTLWGVDMIMTDYPELF